jgi:hypothetical protein
MVQQDGEVRLALGQRRDMPEMVRESRQAHDQAPFPRKPEEGFGIFLPEQRTAFFLIEVNSEPGELQPRHCSFEPSRGIRWRGIQTPVAFQIRENHKPAGVGIRHSEGILSVCVIVAYARTDQEHSLYSEAVHLEQQYIRTASLLRIWNWRCVRPAFPNVTVCVDH